MYKFCFSACFCASRHVQRQKAELTLAQIREKLPNGCADWHQIWHTCANSYENGYTPNKLPFETQGGHLGVLGGQQFKSIGKLSNWHQLWFTSADSSGNGHRLNPSHPSIHQGAFRGGGGGGGVGVGVTNSKVWGSCQTPAPIGTKFGTRRRIRLGMDIG